MQLPKRYWFLLLTSLVTACSSNTPPPVDTTNYSDLANMNQADAKAQAKANKELNPIRAEALKEGALEVGAQGALAKRSEEIDAMLAKNSRYLDQVFNFNAIMLPNNVLPPVLLEGDNAVHVADETTIRIADKMYRIEAQAKFVSVPPTWHDYLWMSFPKPEAPTSTMLPKTDQEQKIWQESVTVGWKQGADQANNIFADNVARLKRDYEGMVLYHQLVNKNMIGVPSVATTNLGVTGGGNAMSVNDQVQRLTNLPTLNPNSEYWKAIVAEPPQYNEGGVLLGIPQVPEVATSSSDMGIK